jgi:hypothetical protein
MDGWMDVVGGGGGGVGGGELREELMLTRLAKLKGTHVISEIINEDSNITRKR